MIRYIIDADSSIYAMVDRDSPVNMRLSECEPGEVVISTISFAEIAPGVQLQKLPPPQVLDAFLIAVPLVAFDEAVARAYATLPFKRARFDGFLAAMPRASGPS